MSIRFTVIIFLEVFIMTIDEAVRIRIQELLKKENMKISQVSLMGGLTPSTLYDFMNGTTVHIQVNTIQQVCAGFKITLSDFFNKNYFNSLK